MSSTHASPILRLASLSRRPRRRFWRGKSRSGSPSDGGVSQETKRLIGQMAESNVGWGAPRIHGEVLKLGTDIVERSVSRFMPPKPRKPPSQTWRTFLD